ncbi:MAG: hypothetical protein FWC81_01105 [Coriobacteriia bacterium]|nr:hypothetical protein [Coriobacteriia bacterium]
MINLQDIIIDPEFKYLLPLLDPESFATLETDILEYGCRDALVLWKDHSREDQSILIDGHNRYEILLKHGLPFSITYMEFDSREEVTIWIITTQIARRNLAALQLSYYRGMHYMADKQLVGRPRNDDDEKSAQTEHILGSTANRLAKKYNVDSSTIRRDARVTQGIAAIGTFSSNAKQKILAGEVPITRTKLQALATAEPARVAEVATAIDDGTFERRPAVDSGQVASAERPATVQDLAFATTSIRRNFTRELRQLERSDDPSTLATAKPVLRAYIASLEELYRQL